MFPSIKKFQIPIVIRAFASMAFILVFCSPQEPLTPFDRIENSRIRPVGMVVLPYPEGAPGDSLQVTAHFSGKPIVRVSDFKICKGEFDTIGTPLSILGPTPALPDSLSFAFGIPDTMLDSVIRQLQTSPGYSSEFNPLIETLQSKYVGSLADLDSEKIDPVVGFLTNLNLKCRVMFTVWAHDGECLKIRKDFMVRYNRKIQNINALASRLPVNHNPSITKVVMYKVKGHGSFELIDSIPSNSILFLQRPPIVRILINDTIEIDTGYSYFLRTFNSDTVDKYIIPYPVKGDASKVKDTVISEKFSYEWFYEQSGGTPSSNNDAMALEKSTNETEVKLYPPLDPSVSGCTIFLKVTDYLDSKTPRPTGSAQIRFTCVFRYSEAYRNAVGQ
jgi:hypothetical protein